MAERAMEGGLTLHKSWDEPRRPMNTRERQTLQLSVVVPVYGGAAALPELRRRLDDVLRRGGYSYELILVDDRGPGDAWPIIQTLAAQHPEVVGVRLSRNFGQHAAIVCGIAEARGEWIITMDDDLEHAPESIPALLDAADAQDHPLVYGIFEQRTHSWFRNATAAGARRVLKWAFPELSPDFGSFRVIHCSLAERLTKFGLHHPFIDGLLSWMTSSPSAVKINHETRRHGRSAYTLPRLIAHTINIFVTFSHVPLRLATYTGTLLASASFLYLAYIVYGKLSGGIANPGYASLMAVILFACGVQLLILGMLGEYVGRLMGATFRRPAYVVEAATTREMPPVATRPARPAGAED